MLDMTKTNVWIQLSEDLSGIDGPSRSQRSPKGHRDTNTVSFGIDVLPVWVKCHVNNDAVTGELAVFQVRGVGRVSEYVMESERVKEYNKPLH